MTTPNVNHAPQPTNPACIKEDSSLKSTVEKILDGKLNLQSGKPTLLGQAPPGLATCFAPVPPGFLPEFSKLPPPRGRCQLTGASRSWLLDMEKLGRVKIVRVRQPGKMRGACFVYVPSLMALLRAGLEGGQDASRN